MSKPNQEPPTSSKNTKLELKKHWCSFNLQKQKIVQNLEHRTKTVTMSNSRSMSHTPSGTSRLLRSPKITVFSVTSRGKSELNVTDMLKHVNTYPDMPEHVLNVQEKDHSKICSNLIDMFKISWTCPNELQTYPNLFRIC